MTMDNMMDDDTNKGKQTKVYAWRWVILTVYGLVTAANGFLWISFSAATSNMVKYYRVSAMAVDHTSTMFFVTTVLLSLPAAMILSRFGLMVSTIIPAACNAIGASIRIGGFARNHFIFITIGQFVASVGAMFILITEARLAAVWFPANERTFATTCGLTFSLLGVSAGFLMSTCMIPSTSDIEELGYGIKSMLYTQTLICFVVFFLVLALFREAPPTPPSLSEYFRPKLIEDGQDMQFWDSLWDLLRNYNYILVTVAYSLNDIVAFTSSTLLSQIAEEEFSTSAYRPMQNRSGWIGFYATLSSIFSTVIVSFILDKNKQFRKVACISSLAATGSLMAFALAIQYQVNMYALGVSFVLVMVLTTPYVGSGLDHVAEIGYPIQEGCSIMPPTTISKCFTVAAIYLLQLAIDNGKKDYCAYILCGMEALSFLLSFMADEPNSRSVTDSIHAGVDYSLS